MKSFVQLVQRQMKAKGISLRGVAKEASMDPSFFSKVLAGKRSPPSDERILKRLAGLLEIDPLQLIISTGMIPSELQGLMESEDFLHALRQGRVPQMASRPAPAPVRAAAAPVRERPAPARPQPAVFIPRSKELSEDLL